MAHTVVCVSSVTPASDPPDATVAAANVTAGHALAASAVSVRLVSAATRQKKGTNNKQQGDEKKRRRVMHETLSDRERERKRETAAGHARWQELSAAVGLGVQSLRAGPLALQV